MPNEGEDPKEQYIYPDGAEHRGRFERSFSEIGALVMGGAAVGATRGLFAGIRDPELQKLKTTAIKRTQLLNHINKSGATVAQAGGSIGLIYALSDLCIDYIRGGADDEFNTLAASTATGFLYSTGSFRAGGAMKLLRGSAVGMAVGLGILGFTSYDKIKELLGR